MLRDLIDNGVSVQACRTCTTARGLTRALEGIDITHKKPKLITQELQLNSDIAIIVCSGNLCPVVYTKHVEDWNIPDPAKMPLNEAKKSET